MTLVRAAEEEDPRDSQAAAVVEEDSGDELINDSVFTSMEHELIDANPDVVFPSDSRLTSGSTYEV